MMSRAPRPRVVLALAALLLGLWIALAPFTRPLAGGAAFSLEATPEIGCRTPVVGILGDDRPIGEVYASPRPSAGEPMVERVVDCTGHARFRVGLGGLLVVVGLAGLTVGRRQLRPAHSPAGPFSGRP